MRTFELDSKKWCTVDLCNGDKCCVIGQYLNKVSHIPKSQLTNGVDSKGNDVDWYYKFQSRTGLPYKKVYTINDKGPELTPTKIQKLKELFKSVKIKLVVK